MSKTHVVNLTITNNTDFPLEYNDDWFDSGRLADGNSWPSSIAPHTAATIECCEKDWSAFGCSGWTKYNLQGVAFYFCFSNPVAGTNGIDIGTETSVWNGMTGHYDCSIKRTLAFQNDNLWVIAEIKSTSGNDNQASWELKILDTDIISPANIEMIDVPYVFNNISPNGTRQYYQCGNAPTHITGLALSHFKGIASFADKIIFSHTNIDIGSTNGRYLIADEISCGNQGVIDATYDTSHPGWYHPCAAQACGSFMAMGIQESADGPGSNISQIEIYDIRKAQVNQPIQLIGTIERPTEGINGVAITKEIGPDGKYIVAGVNGGSLTIYRSSSSSLIPISSFDVILTNPNFAESGAGLALVTQTNGRIYLFTFNDDDLGGNSKMCLYSLNLGTTPTCTKVVEKDMPIPGMSESITLLQEYIAAIILADPLIGGVLSTLLLLGRSVLNSSFRWGKGLAITSANTVEVYATDRNVLPLSQIPLVGSNKDFSLVVWKNPSINVDLSLVYNLEAIFPDGISHTAPGLGGGYGYSSTALGTSAVYQGNNYVFGATGSNNAVHNATIPLPSGSYSRLGMLATGANNNQPNQVITVNYTDGTASTFTQNFSDWGRPQTYSGESIAVHMAYRLMTNGNRDPEPYPYNLYGYSFPLDSTKTVSNVVLPANANVTVLAMNVIPVSMNVDLSSVYNLEAIFADGISHTSPGLGGGYGYSSTALGTSAVYQGNNYVFGATGSNNAVHNATIPLPSGSYSRLGMLATGANNNQTDQIITVNYTDGTASTFTQNFSDWGRPQSYEGQGSAVQMAYRLMSDGTVDQYSYDRSIPWYLYGYSFTLDSTKTVSNVVLPANANVTVLAMNVLPV